MANSRKTRKSTATNKSGGYQRPAKIKSVSYSYDIKSLYKFLDGFTSSSKKYNSIDIKVDSQLVKSR